MTLDGYIICEIKGKVTAKVLVNKIVIQNLFDFYEMYKEEYQEELYTDAYFKVLNPYCHNRGKAVVDFYILRCIRFDLPFIVHDLEN